MSQARNARINRRRPATAAYVRARYCIQQIPEVSSAGFALCRSRLARRMCWSRGGNLAQGHGLGHKMALIRSIDCLMTMNSIQLQEPIPARRPYLMPTHATDC